MIRITMEDGKTIDIELDEKAAPITCANFIKLVRSGFYDGLTIHRMEPGFRIWGGCPNTSGIGGPGWTIKGEFKDNGWDNPLKHKRGVITMSRGLDKDSAGSQFMILCHDYPYFDGKYAAFGRVVAGMDAVDALSQTGGSVNFLRFGTPKKQPVMKTVREIKAIEE